MNTPTLTTTEASAEEVNSLEAFREQVAVHYANILHGRHLHRAPMGYKFPLALTGVVIGEHELQPHLATHLAAKLNVDIEHLGFTYKTVVCKKQEWNKKSELEIRLEIVATVTNL